MLRPCPPSLVARSPWLLICFVILLRGSFSPRCCCDGCVRDDRGALLDIRSEFTADYPPDWSNRDCCRWTGVTCNSRTGRVTGLDLVGFGYLGSGLLNATVFLPLTELHNLDLSGRLIQGCKPDAGFEVWSKLHKLEILDLSGNELTDSSIPSLVAVSSIRSLFLSYNSLRSALTIQQLSTMMLDSLDLKGNFINGMLSTGICNMANLRELDLSNLMLFGDLPSCIGNLTSLRILDLSKNLLNVKFPSLSFANFTSLVELSLSGNNLEGPLFLNSLSNNSQLTHLELSSSSDHFQVWTENPATNLSAQLQVLVLPNCNLNGKSAITPSFLLHQPALEIIDMSNNNLSSHFPSWLIENNTKLSHLILRGNSFIGPLFLPPRVHINLLWLDASCNSLRKLHKDINITLPNLHYLNLSVNSFQGVFPYPFGYMGSLAILDLSYNYFFDNIGAAFFGTMSNISALFLSRNIFYGSFPKDILLYKIYYLVLNNNKITGRIPDSICRSKVYLGMLDISNNELTGSIPTCIYALPRLAMLNLRGNSLVGSIPLELCNLKNLVFLDLSKNSLSGPMHCLPNLLHIHLSENRLNETFPFPLSLGTKTVTLDLRGNQFSSTIPTLIDKAFPDLRVLLLEGNMFEGIIPNEICHLKYLRLLDLSHNKLSGQLISCLSNMGLDGDYHPFLYGNKNPNLIYNMPLAFSQADDHSAQYRNLIWLPDQEEFLTKSRQEYYKGSILNYMSGLDFSANQLNGSIPETVGNMAWLRALNFSNNYLDGLIPKSLSNLSNLESLDLSHNSLAGQIPPELVAMQSLEVFSVAYNNLSGPTPGTMGQFITFDLSSYQGNPYLCGPPLLKSCTAVPLTENEDDDKVADIILFGCSVVFYIVGFWTSLAVLYFKTSWRWSWFLAVDRLGDFLMVQSALFIRKIRSTD